MTVSICASAAEITPTSNVFCTMMNSIDVRIVGRVVDVDAAISNDWRISCVCVHPAIQVDKILCRSLSYLLTCSSRLVYWLSSLIAIERVYMTVMLDGHWLKKPSMARRLVVHCYELISYKAFFDLDGGTTMDSFPFRRRSTWENGAKQNSPEKCTDDPPSFMTKPIEFYSKTNRKITRGRIVRNSASNATARSIKISVSLSFKTCMKILFNRAQIVNRVLQLSNSNSFSTWNELRRNRINSTLVIL